MELDYGKGSVVPPPGSTRSLWEGHPQNPEEMFLLLGGQRYTAPEGGGFIELRKPRWAT